MKEGRCVTCAQDRDSRSHLVGRHVPGIQLSMQIRQLVCSVSACIALPCSYLQDAPHLRDDPCLQGEPTEGYPQLIPPGKMSPVQNYRSARKTVGKVTPWSALPRSHAACPCSHESNS